MAVEALGKTLDQLKKDRTVAKTSFTRQANYLGREAGDLTESELRQEFAKLSAESRKVIEANDDYRTGLEAELEASEDGEDAALSTRQDADLNKSASECEQKFKDVKQIVQTNLWSRYGSDTLEAAFGEAEKTCRNAYAIPVESSNCEGFEIHHTVLERLIKGTSNAFAAWESWIPAAKESDFRKRSKDLRVAYNELDMMRGEFARARRIAVEKQGTGVKQEHTGPTIPVVKLKPTKLPTFSGCKRDFHRWRTDWESLQRQGEPTRSPEVKKIQLLDSVEEKIVKDLRLSTYSTADDVFRVLANRFGNKYAISLEIVEELDKILPVKGNQPRKVVDLIQTIEKALADLTDLGSTGAIKNPLVVNSLESKLPEWVKKDWLMFMVDPSNSVTQDNHFDMLLAFLKKQEEIFERLEHLQITDKPDKAERKFNKKYASTKATKREDVEEGCILCGDEKHKDRIFFCRKFRGLKLSEKEAAVKRIGACRECLGCHKYADGCRDTYLCRNADCKKRGPSDHHFFLCPRGNSKRRELEKPHADDRDKKSLTEEQKKFLGELTPELAERCRKAFTNNSSKVSCPAKDQVRLLKESGLRELPVIMMLMEVTANAGQKIGALVDLASDTNYITHKAANRLNLRSEKITLVVHGVGGMATKVATRRYLLRVRIKTSKGTERAHELICYGLKEIAKVHQVVRPEELRRFFPEVELEELRRPEEIELLISHREGRLAPQRVKVVGDLVLWESPLGKTVGGAHPDLFEEVNMAAHESKTHFARSMRTAAIKYEEIPAEVPFMTKTVHMQDTIVEARHTATTHRDFLEWWKWDSIGAACEPKCGGCRCGNCQPGGKEMTLAEERELEIIKDGLTYIMEDEHSKSPHWDARYPWIMDPACLPNNRSGVEATFLRTEKRLRKEPEWLAAYTAQIHEMVERGAAKRLTKKMAEDWRGPVWYVSHLVAPNPHSVTTPVRLVWNSSQKFKGVSMNDLLLKGPDVLNPIRAVLLRFRKGVHAALGDIRKMYNSVWLEEREMHLHRFLWRDRQDEEIGEYVITRVNIGDRPAGCIAQLAMRETARLTKFSHLEEAQRVLEEDSYVDDILTSHNDANRLSEVTKEIEEILQAGGFSLKPWVQSTQSGRQESGVADLAMRMSSETHKTFVLPNQMRDEDNKALGIGYLVEEDKLYMMASINFSRRRGKMRIGQDLLMEEVRSKTPDPLTRRLLLSQVAGLYDPIGLVTPLKQTGAILVRKAFQETGSGNLAQNTWDKPLSEGLREEAIKLFEEYAHLGQIKFHRSLTPLGWKGKPWAITFSDGSDKSYGAVLYLRWETEEGLDIRLLESKAKLTPLDQKGDAVKAEVCGAVFAARLRKYMERHGRMEIERWFHLVDSQTVLGAIQRDSYGYQTFFANRIGEIQKSASVEDWWWIPGHLNIADTITRGAALKDLQETWQSGPEFLRRPLEEWPIKSAEEVVTDARDSISKLQRKAFSAVMTRGQVKRCRGVTTQEQTKADDSVEKNDTDPTHLIVCPDALETYPEMRQGEVAMRVTLSGSAVKTLLEVKRFSCLFKLVNVVAWVRQAADSWLGLKEQTTKKSKWEASPSKEESKVLMLNVEDCEYAFRTLCLAAQEGITFPDTTLNRLVVVKHKDELLLCGGRIQAFREDKSLVPILPQDAWISTLLAREAHDVNHEGIAGTLLRMRRKAWVVKGRRIAKKVVDNCVICRKARAKRCQQIMSDLPPERTAPAGPFQFTAVDLFGPYDVKDEVKKRVRLKVWGIVFSCMASRAIHADIVSDMSAEGFLLAYQRFTSLRGHPSKVWSDPGTNFVGAKPALEDLYRFLENLERSGVEEKAAKNGTKWSWKIHPADSPHRNGAAEAAVRTVKKALQNVGGNGVFTWGEFQTFVYMAANLANERPVDARAQSQEDCVEYITPNSLLLGRASLRGDPVDFQFEGYPYKRLRVIQSEVNKFWKKWCQLAGPNLFVRSKWHTKERNVAVGDIVWLADQNALRGQFKLGRVISAFPDEKGVVRDVKVRTFPSYPVMIKKPSHKEHRSTTAAKKYLTAVCSC